MSKIIELAESYIDNFNLEKNEYVEINESQNGITIIGLGEVFIKSHQFTGKLVINFGRTSKCKVFLGENFRGGAAVDFHSDVVVR